MAENTPQSWATRFTVAFGLIVIVLACVGCSTLLVMNGFPIPAEMWTTASTALGALAMRAAINTSQGEG
jgi:hypothetical protein